MHAINFERHSKYTDGMQLHVARLCLDCNEVHDAQDCPRCGSEAFAYLSRWVPAPERRLQTRASSSPEAEVYRELIEPASSTTRRGRLLKRGAVGISVLAVAGWLWRRNDDDKKPRSEQARGKSGEQSSETSSSTRSG
jgi:predicted  nucleic acid-binding Zn-ribbon protein